MTTTTLQENRAVRKLIIKAVRRFCYVALVVLTVFRIWIAFDDDKIKGFANNEFSIIKRF